MSFLAYILIATNPIGGDEGSRSHPPYIMRIGMMQRVLEKRRLRIPLPDGPFRGFQDLARLYYFAYESRSKILRRHHAMIHAEHVENGMSEQCPAVAAGPLTQFADNILAKIDVAVRNEKELTADDFGRISRLAERVSQGVLIGSYVDKSHLDAALQTCAGIDLGLHQPAALLEPTSEEMTAYNTLKPLIQETRTTPWEIINAGWLHKTQVVYPEAFDLFFRKAGSVLDKIDDFDSRLQATDKVLLKSIEVAQIHKMFGRTQGM